MANELEMENNKIGSAIQYFRESYQISQGKLCMGLCSIATLSRIEAGERDVDSLLLETLLERLGRMPNQFELILTEFDYELYQKREEIKKQTEAKEYSSTYALLQEYEQIAATKGNVHVQFIKTYHALLNELNGGTIEATIDLLMQAITCTVPDFKTSEIKDYYLSNSELNIIVDILERMVSAEMNRNAKQILKQVLDYLELHNSLEDNSNLYSKVALIAGRIYMKENNLKKALEICSRGFEKCKGSRKMDYLGELTFIKAQATEGLFKVEVNWEEKKKDCLKLYLQAYYVLSFREETDAAKEIREHLKGEYQWEDID
jgi:transcriptional regulator with XRE-family HTH domain